MNELLKKVSSYNIFNYLFPGAVFAYLVEQMTEHKLLQENIIVALFFYYFIGLVISRIGSLVIEPIIKSSGFAPHSPYEDYVTASKRDEAITVLSEQNNMYRTLLSMIFCIFCILIFDKAASLHPIFSIIAPTLLLIVFALLFLFAYKKQTAYITKRINLEKNND